MGTRAKLRKGTQEFHVGTQVIFAVSLPINLFCIGGLYRCLAHMLLLISSRGE